MLIDTYKKDVDDLVKRKLSYDWTSLRNDIKSSGSDTQHCPFKCRQRVDQLYQMLRTALTAS